MCGPLNTSRLVGLLDRTCMQYNFGSQLSWSLSTRIASIATT